MIRLSSLVRQFPHSVDVSWAYAQRSLWSIAELNAAVVCGTCTSLLLSELCFVVLVGDEAPRKIYNTRIVFPEPEANAKL